MRANKCKFTSRHTFLTKMRARGLEPLFSPWQGDVLPLDDARLIFLAKSA